jgi:tetratricopeptide (TPR) repeat protein
VPAVRRPAATPAIVRVAAVLLALAVMAWLAVGIHNTRSQLDGLKTTFRPPPGIQRADYERADSYFEEATLLNPDQRPTYYRGALRALVNRDAEAAIYIERVIAREPGNVEAWNLLRAIAPDPGRAAEARAKLKELQPLRNP